MRELSNILLVKNRALGDSVMGLSSVEYVRALYPKANIIYAVPQWVAPLYREVKTEADSIYPLSLKSMKDFFKTYQDLKKLKIDHIHEMHQSGRGAKAFGLMAFLMGIKYTAHNHHKKTGTKVHDQGVIKPLIQRDLDGVYSFLGEKTIPQFLDYPPRIDVLNKEEKKARIIMGVVATRQTKMWPLQNYLSLAKILETAFPQFEVVIPLSKSADDEKIKQALESLGLPHNTSIVHIPLSGLPRFFSESAFYIGNDTGLKHIAVAVGLKSFTLFGPEPANEWHPYDEKKHPFFYVEGLACRTRTHHYCGLSVCDLKDEYMQCMKLFTPEKVMEAIASTCTDFLHSRDL